MTPDEAGGAGDQSVGPGSNGPAEPSSSGPSHVVSFTYQAPAMKSAYWRVSLRSLGVFWVGALLTTLLLVLAWLRYPSSVFAASLASFFIGVLSIYVGTIVQGSRAMETRVKTMRNPTVRVVLDDESCRVESSEATGSFTWHAVRELHRFDRVWVLCGLRGQALVYLDSSALPAETRAFLERKVLENRGRVC